MSGLTLEELAERGEAALAHAGVKGMKWGVRKDRSSSSSAAPKLSLGQKKAIIAIVGTGSAVATAMLAGPVGGMAVSGITRAIDAVVTTKSEQSPMDAFKDTKFPTVNSGGSYNLERNKLGVLSPGGR